MARMMRDVRMAQIARRFAEPNVFVVVVHERTSVSVKIIQKEQFCVHSSLCIVLLL